MLFSLGIGLYFSLPFEPPLALSAIILFIGVAFTSLFKHKSLVILVIILSGFFASCVRTSLIDAPMIEKKLGPVDIIGTVESIEKMEEGGGSRVVLSHIEIERLSPDKTPKKIRLRLRADDGIKAGQRIKALGSLTPQSSPLYPNGFDFRRYMYFKQIGAVGFIYRQPEIIKDTSFYFSGIESLRQKIANKIVTTLPPEQSGIAMALLIGQKAAIPDDDREAIKAAGLAHMLAISGLHIGIFAGTVFFVIRIFLSLSERIALRYSSKKIAAVFALFGAVFYMLIAGATIPTQRAVLMSGIVFSAIILDRSPISLRLVGFSALVVLIISPESLMSASFQMSFAAVSCLVTFYDITRRFWIETYRRGGFARKLSLYFIGVCTTTIIASIATAPFALYHFGQVSFLGSLANLAAVPILAFIVMPFALLSLILMPFGIHDYALIIIGFGIDLILEISYWAASLPHAVINTPAWNFVSFVFLVCGGLWIILWTGWGRLGALLFFALSVMTLDFKSPDILVSSSHDLVGVFHDHNLYVTTKRKEKFVRENWEVFYGLEEGAAQSLNFKGGNRPRNDFGVCGEAGCRFEIKGHNISFLKNPYYQNEECQWADFLIAENPVDYKTNCKSQIVIDKFSTWRNGAHAIYINVGQINIETVGQSIGNRPWTIQGRGY
ncbi:MAG: ComEC/Rec2 family competence protein [Alphaproteobacteria bacterium]